MSIYDKVRDNKPVNPAIALYNYWHSVLVGHPSTKRNHNGILCGNMRWGDGWYNLGFHHEYMASKPDTSARPPINYGGMTLRRDGTFRLGSYFGWKQRDNMARNTFLRWGYVHGEYVWWVDTSNAEGNFHGSRGGPDLKDWHNQIPYVAEWVAGGKNWSRPGAELKLVWDGKFGAWTIAFHKKREHTSYQKPTTQETFDWYAALRDKRYRRYERAHLIATGAIQRSDRSPAEVAKREERNEELVQVLVAHMNVHTAARIVPLRKTTEEVGLWEPSGLP